MGKSSNFLARPTNTPSGIATGGGDTGLTVQPQPHLFTIEISSSQQPKDFRLPAGTMLLETWLIPRVDAMPTAGVVSLTDVTNTIAYATNLDATVVSRETLTTPGQLPEETRFRASQTGLSAGSTVAIGFVAIVPQIRT